MGIKTIYTDDIDGSELGSDAEPLTFAVQGQQYSIYLSSAHKADFYEALSKFTENAEKVSAKSTAPSTNASDKEKIKKVRAWAQSTGYKFEGADGKLKTLGDKGRVPDEVIAAYDKAND